MTKTLHSNLDLLFLISSVVLRNRELQSKTLPPLRNICLCRSLGHLCRKGPIPTETLREVFSTGWTQPCVPAQHRNGLRTMEVISNNLTTSLKKAEKVLERAYFESAGQSGSPGCFISISWTCTLVEIICAHAAGFKKNHLRWLSMAYTEQIFFLMNDLAKTDIFYWEKKLSFKEYLH